MKNEYIIWGIPENGEYEEVLYTKAESYQEAKHLANFLEQYHGCRNTRVQVLDWTNPWDNVQKFFN